MIGSSLGILSAVVLGPLPPARRGVDAARDRRERDPDHRVLADLQRLVRSALAGAANGDRRSPLLLPGDGQHPARPDLGAALPDRADALVRSGRIRDLPPRPRPDRAAVCLLGIESRDRPRDDRRNRERLLRNLRLARGSRSRTPSRSSTSKRRGRRSSMASILGVLMYVAVATRRTHLSSSGIQPVRKGELHEGEDTPRARSRSSSPPPRSPRGVQHVARDADTEAHEGDAAAEVGDAGTVRRLLRGVDEGLLQEARPRRER